MTRLLKPHEQTGAIKLSRYKWAKQKREMWEELVWPQEEFVFPECHLCGQLIRSYEHFEPDHIITKGMGGGSRDDRRENLKPSHSWCNRRRGSKRL